MVTIARFVNSRGVPSPHLLICGVVVAVLLVIDSARLLLKEYS